MPLFVDGLRDRDGRIPLTGLPRITRPRHRANNAGLSGFSLIDPAGNWIRVTRRADDDHEPRSVNGRTEWVSAGGGPLAGAVGNAVVLADSHGDEVHAQRTWPVPSPEGALDDTRLTRKPARPSCGNR